MFVLFALCLGFAGGILFCKLVAVLKENNSLKNKASKK